MPVRKEYQTNTEATDKAQTINIAAADTMELPRDAITKPGRTFKVPHVPVTDDAHRRQLGHHLTKMYYLQANVVNEVNTRYTQSTDLIGIANIMATYYAACEREYQDRIDYKAKGVAGYGHSLTSPEIATVARSIVMIFGPELMLDPQKQKLFLETLEREAQDAADSVVPTRP